MHKEINYDKLITFLREHAKKDGCKCDTCPFYEAEKRGYNTCSEEMAEKAADAIEALNSLGIDKIHPQDGDVVILYYEKGQTPFDTVDIAFRTIKSVLPDNVSLVGIPKQTSLQACDLKQLTEIKQRLEKIIQDKENLEF